MFPILIPVVSAVLYLVGGQWWKPARWLMGIPIFLLWSHILCCHQLVWWNLLAIPAYWIATSAFPYGQSSWLNFLGEWGKFFVCGLVLGAASFCCLGWIVALVQTIVSAVAFVVIKFYDDEGVIHNPRVELLRGFLGTICYVF